MNEPTDDQIQAGVEALSRSSWWRPLPLGNVPLVTEARVANVYRAMHDAAPKPAHMLHDVEPGPPHFDEADLGDVIREHVEAVLEERQPAALVVSGAAVEAAIRTYWAGAHLRGSEGMRRALEAALVVIRAEEGR